MQNDYSQFEQREQDSIERALMPGNQSREINFFDHIHLRHQALADLNFSDITHEDIGPQRRELSEKNALSLSENVKLWSSGAVRNGLDAAKLFALGVVTVGFAKPMLKAALNSIESLVQHIATIEYELKTALLYTGSATSAALKENACL